MKMEDLRLLNPLVEAVQWRNRLPHWQQEGRVYFVTFRLGDAVPAHLLDQWNADRTIWLARHPAPWSLDTETEYHRRFTGAIDRWLDAGHGSCVLRRPECREVVADALRFHDGKRCTQLAWVVMPNHVHVLFALLESWTLDSLLHSWKRFAAREINRTLRRRGALWQKDYFDRLVRDGSHLANCVRYIRRNPLKARLGRDEFSVYESELVSGLP